MDKDKTREIVLGFFQAVNEGNSEKVLEEYYHPNINYWIPGSSVHGDGEISIWINGEKAASSNSSIPKVISAGRDHENRGREPLWIGCLPAYTESIAGGGYSGIANDNNWPKQYHNFSGGMSQIYVYSEALSDEKMKALYNETKWRYQ